MATAELKRPIKYLFEYEHGIDDKRRLQIPSKWRPPDDEPSPEYVLLLWQPTGQTRPCLLALPPEAFLKFCERVEALPMMDVKAEALRRSLTCAADEVVVDSAGRICVPQALAEKAGIQKKAVLVGMLDRFQIWSPEHYAVVKAEDAANRAAALSLI